MAQTGTVTLDANTITNPTLRPTPPSFRLIHRAPDSSVTLVITNTPGLALTLQTSANLTNWTTLATPTLAASPDTFTDTTEATTDRFNASNRTFDALTYAAADVGYGPLLFYYLSH